MNPRVSIVIPTFERDADLKRLIESIKVSDCDQKYIEIIVVDNAQSHSMRAMLDGIDNNILLVSPNKNTFSNGARRLGSEVATGDYVFFVDDDNVLDPRAIRLLAASMDENKALGLVAPFMCYLSRPDVIWSAGGKLSWLGLAKYPENGESLRDISNSTTQYEPDFYPNAFMTSKAILKAEPLDDVNFPHNWAEPDFSLRVKALGYHLKTINGAVTWHDIDYRGAMTRLGGDKTYDQARSRIVFRKKYMNHLGIWLGFWALVFPISTFVYIKKIISQQGMPKNVLIGSYFRGTWDGIRARLISHSEGTA